jgi:hypothetical protein
LSVPDVGTCSIFLKSRLGCKDTVRSLYLILVLAANLD